MRKLYVAATEASRSAFECEREVIDFDNANFTQGKIRPVHLIIYIMMRGDRDSLSYLVMNRWEKCWDTAKKVVSIRSMPIPA